MIKKRTPKTISQIETIMRKKEDSKNYFSNWNNYLTKLLQIHVFHVHWISLTWHFKNQYSIENFWNCWLIALFTETFRYTVLKLWYRCSVILSSLHNIIFNSFWLVFILWRLLHQDFLFLSYVIVVQKSYLQACQIVYNQKAFFFPTSWLSKKVLLVPLFSRIMPIV